jgi:hypothetical protein
MTLTDILMIAATAISPLIAVQVTRYLQDRKERRSQQLRVFKVLMATRAYSLSPGHVEALNSIDLEFAGSSAGEKLVLESWQAYLDHLGSTNPDDRAWSDKRIDLQIDLLHSMAKCLGYDFNKTQIKNASYSPKMHGRIEAEQESLRRLTLEVLEGKRPISMHVVNLPSSAGAE